MTYIQLLTPKDASQGNPCVVHLAGTGDHGFERRMRLGGPLLEKVATACQGFCVVPTIQ